MRLCTPVRRGSFINCSVCGRRIDAPGAVCGVDGSPGGPGTELKAILSGWPFRLSISSTCKCNHRAATMDAWGADGCESRMSEIVGWLRSEARERNIFFSDAIARLLVSRAISRARKRDATKR